MRLFLPAAALVVLLVPATAGAHGSIRPTAATAGEVQRFVVTIPNTFQLASGAVGLTVMLPAGATVESAESRAPRWRVRMSGRTITWAGGQMQGRSESFAFRARMPSAEGTYELSGQERYEEGSGPRFPLAVTVTRSAAPAPSGDGGVWVAIAVAAAIVLLAAGAATLRTQSGRRRVPQP